MSSLQTIIRQLEVCRRKVEIPYFIPGLWIDALSTETARVDPYAFYHRRLVEIADSPPQPLVPSPGSGEWTRRAIIYNLFPRVTTAFDHANDGILATHPNDDGWRETGTLLKCIALLPYIRNMGFNTIHLLPIMSIGQDNKKGTLGSPYAIRNLYQFDASLDEPALDLGADQLFAGFVEAAHLLGMRVVMEFVLRIASRDNDWIPEHPDWFYWIRADVPDRAGKVGRTTALNTFGSPIFTPGDLNLLKSKISQNDFQELPPPPERYRNFYTLPPRPDQITLENGRYFGTLDDGTHVRIPGAFADWPPDDHQPLWSDVTYLRMYHHPDFNYMAYNTVRMYDAKLAAVENRNIELWEALVGVIPFYQQTFGIDGVMMDMGHALPMELKQQIVNTARAINPDFALWDENFSIGQQSRDEGYNAVMGYWMLSAHFGDDVRKLLREMSYRAFPIAFFAAPENHNTPRAAARLGGFSYAHYALALAITTPPVPFILSGFELGETQPINTGLGFSADELARYPTDGLPLFSAWAFNWTNSQNLVQSVTYALSLRRKHEDVFANDDPHSFVLGRSDNPALIVYSRAKGNKLISIIANADPLREQQGRAVINTRSHHVAGLWGTTDAGMSVVQEEITYAQLSPNYVLIIDGKKLPR